MWLAEYYYLQGNSGRYYGQYYLVTWQLALQPVQYELVSGYIQYCYLQGEKKYYGYGLSTPSNLSGSIYTPDGDVMWVASYYYRSHYPTGGYYGMYDGGSRGEIWVGYGSNGLSCWKYYYSTLSSSGYYGFIV